MRIRNNVYEVNKKKLCSDTGSYYPLARVDFFYGCECALVIINIIV